MRAIVIVALAGCSISDVDFTGKSCPCPTGYECDLPTQMCTRDLAPPTDGRPPGDTPTDTPMAQSCLGAPLTSQIYTSPTFADFSTAWMAGGGNWAPMNNEVVQSNTLSQLSFLAHPVIVSNYRVVTTMRATSTGAGNAIEIALRIDAVGTNMYHCNWEPFGGAFLIQRTDSINGGAVIKETTINTNTIPGYSPTNSFTMEFQVIDNDFECCMRDIQGASLTGTDTMYGNGDVGLKTYQMSGAFRGFEVYVKQ